MDITQAIAALKQEPDFAKHVGMILIHNGTVRAWSRNNHSQVTAITVEPNLQKMQEICQEMQQEPGIFRIIAHAQSGTLYPGDDILHLIVAGDIRENVKRTLSTLLDRIKSEAVFKKEILIE